MKRIQVEVDETIDIKFNQLANAIADLHSDDFAELMAEIFDYIESKCGDQFKYDSQLCWIAGQSPDSFKKAVLALAEFYKLEDEKQIKMGGD